MFSASPYVSLDPYRPSFRRRATAFALTVIAHLLLLLMFLRLAPPVQKFLAVKRNPMTFSLLPEKRVAGARTAARVKRESGGARPKRAAVTPPVPPSRPPPVGPLNMVILTPEDYAASDIAKMHPHKESGADAGAGTASAGRDSGSAEGAGEGPGGERLYNAEWYRRPTHAELSYYLPASAPRVGWGMIACQTVEKYHVDNCRELGDSPPGSGFARAVRQAAWQFLVLPPRIGGRPMVGSWVRIRIDFTETEVK